MKTLLLTAAAALLFTAGASASTIDERGYQACEDRIVSEFKDEGVMLNRRYYFTRSEDGRTYYINGAIWNDGKRVAGRAACKTTANGREVVEFRTDFGSYVLDGTAIVAR